MSMIYLAIGILLAIAVFFGYKSFSAGRDPGVAEQLRALLLARADGSLGEEEFARRQAALHAALVQPRPTAKRAPLILAGLALMIVAGIAAYHWRAKPQTPAQTMALPESGPLDTHIGKTAEAPNKPSILSENWLGDIKSTARQWRLWL